MNNYNFVQASLAEFLNVWSIGGDASLNLTTTGGRVNMAFNVSLGNPGSAFSSPSSSVRRQRHRGQADKEKSRQRAAARQAAAAKAVTEPETAADHQETLKRATSPPMTASLPSPPAQGIKPPFSMATTWTTVPVMTPTFASVTARSEKGFNCDQCTAVLTNEEGLKIHKANTHTMLVRKPAPSMRLYKTMYYHPKDPCPFNAPPPPECKSCHKTMAWTASRTKSNKHWLHEYSCSACTGIHGLSTRSTLTTPPLS